MWRLASLKPPTSKPGFGDLYNTSISRPGPQRSTAYPIPQRGTGWSQRLPGLWEGGTDQGCMLTLVCGGQMAGRTCRSQEAGLTRQEALPAFPAICNHCYCCLKTKTKKNPINTHFKWNLKLRSFVKGHYKLSFHYCDIQG